MSTPRSILVVDDDRDNVESLAMMLRIWGHDVRAAKSGAEALVLVNGWTPDVAVLDLAMPGMTGYELAPRLREACGSGLMLVAVSGYGDSSHHERALAAGFDRCLLKPIDLEELTGLLA